MDKPAVHTFYTAMESLVNRLANGEKGAFIELGILIAATIIAIVIISITENVKEKRKKQTEATKTEDKE